MVRGDQDGKKIHVHGIDYVINSLVVCDRNMMQHHIHVRRSPGGNGKKKLYEFLNRTHKPWNFSICPYTRENCVIVEFRGTRIQTEESIFNGYNIRHVAPILG